MRQGEDAEGFHIFEPANGEAKRDGEEDRRLAEEGLVEVDETGAARGVDDVGERVADHGGAAVDLLSLGEVEALHPHPPRDDGGVEETVLVVDGGAILERLAVDNLGVDDGVPVGLAAGELELGEVPGAVLPAGIGPLLGAIREESASLGGGAGGLAGSLVAIEGASAVESLVEDQAAGTGCPEAFEG